MEVDGGQNPSATVQTVEQVMADRSAGQSGGGGRPRACDFWQVPEVQAHPYDLDEVLDLVEGETYTMICYFADQPNWYSEPYFYMPDFIYTPAAMDEIALILAREAYAQVPLEFPVPHTSPDRDTELLVGLPTWLWIDSAAWRTVDATASLPGIAVTVTATPERVVWDLGERAPDGKRVGAEVVCDGAGTPYDSAGSGRQRSDCAYVYQWISAHQGDGGFDASVTIEWSVSYEASTGQSGSLDGATRTTSFPLRVTERQAVVTYGAT